MSTLDTKIEIPEDAPLAMAHDEDARSDALDAQEAHAKAVKEAEKGPEVGPREPGDDAKAEKKSAKKSD